MKLVHDADWRSRWEWIRKGLDEVKQGAGDKVCPWIPDDIYHALTNRAAFLWLVVKDDGSELGFLVLQDLACSYERVMFVWAIWAEAFSLIRHKHLIIAELDNVARAAGIKVIRHSSPHDGWASTKLFVPVSTIYEREVTP